MAMSPRLLRPRASGVFTPRSIAGLGLWLDASNTSSLTFNSNTVSEWRDLSGNARHYSQATAAQQPNGTARTRNGRRVLDFADGQTLAGNAAARGLSRSVGAITMIAVASVDSMTQPPVGGIRTIWASSGGTALGRSVILYRAGITGDGTLEVGGRRLDSDSFASFGYAANTNANVLSGVIDYANSDAFIYQNGTLRASEPNFLTSGNTSDADATWTSLGASSDATGAAVNNQLDGFIGEVCVYRRALSSAERLTVERYLGAKWGITVA